MIGFITMSHALGLPTSTVATASRGSIIGGSIVLGVVGLIFILLGILFLRTAARLGRTGSDLRKQGVTVSGVIIDRGSGKTAYSSPRSGGGNVYHVSYRYECEGNAYSHRQQVRKKDYTKLPTGTDVSVRCLARDPAVAQVVDSRKGSIVPDASRGDPLTFAVLGVCFLGLALVLAGVALSVVLTG